MIDYAQQVKDSGARIVFCEPDNRIIHAAHELKHKHGLEPILVGDEDEYRQAAQDERLLKDLTITPVDPEKYADAYHELRKHKNISKPDARKALEDPAFYSCMMLQQADADGLVCGASWPSANTIRPALKILADGLASSFFIMKTDKGEFVFADCALNVQPSVDELVQIAKNTASEVEAMGLEPRIAMLSFSTKGSASHPDQEKVMRATNALTQYRDEQGRSWSIDGEVQVDDAMDPEVAARKDPNSSLQGEADIFIFPDLDAGNIGYKLVQQFTDCEAIGPITAGLTKPVNDLSRGCDVDEAIQVALITAWQSQQE